MLPDSEAAAVVLPDSEAAAVVSPDSEAAAYELLEQLRWAATPARCPHCAVVGSAAYLRPADGFSRRTRTGHRSHRRVWRCTACRRQFTVLTGTILQGTKVRLGTWIEVVARCADAPAVTAAEVARDVGLTGEAARVVLGRIRAARSYAAAADRRGGEQRTVRDRSPEPPAPAVEVTPAELSAAAVALIRAALSLPPDAAAAVRDSARPRKRPLRQDGPSADYGEDQRT